MSLQVLFKPSVDDSFLSQKPGSLLICIRAAACASLSPLFLYIVRVMVLHDRKGTVAIDGERLGLHVFPQHHLEIHCKPWMPSKCSGMTLSVASSPPLCQGWTGTKRSRENIDHAHTTSFVHNTSFKILKLYEHRTENTIFGVIFTSSWVGRKARIQQFWMH